MEKFGKEYHKEYYKKRRQAVLDYLGGKCAVCETTENLEVDHKEKDKKSFHINKRMSVKNNKAELDKCQLLCETHHRVKTAIENSGFTHGTMYAWMKKKCNCSDCSKAKREWHDKRNEARRKIK
jgi:5-methylcytosine-specific restriction endonuclease McrA